MSLNKEYINVLAKDLMFELSEDEVNDIIDEFDVLSQQLELLQSIDTTGIEEMIYPFEEETSFLREDEVVKVISQEDAISNAYKVKSGHILVPKVVK